MEKDDLPVIYWDSSAILSALFKDRYSDQAQDWANKEAIHLLSTLAYSETCAVIARLQRDHVLADVLTAAALEVLNEGPWHRLNVWPDWEIVLPLSTKWPLRGADLWHLATAKSLQRQLPGLFLLTFDTKLVRAASGEGISKQD